MFANLSAARAGELTTSSPIVYAAQARTSADSSPDSRSSTSRSMCVVATSRRVLISAVSNSIDQIRTATTLSLPMLIVIAFSISFAGNDTINGGCDDDADDEAAAVDIVGDEDVVTIQRANNAIARS